MRREARQNKVMNRIMKNMSGGSPRPTYKYQRILKKYNKNERTSDIASESEENDVVNGGDILDKVFYNRKDEQKKETGK